MREETPRRHYIPRSSKTLILTLASSSTLAVRRREEVGGTGDKIVLTKIAVDSQGVLCSFLGHMKRKRTAARG